MGLSRLRAAHKRPEHHHPRHTPMPPPRCCCCSPDTLLPVKDDRGVMMSANAPSLLHCGNGRSVLGPPRPSRPAALASGRLAGYTATAPAGRRAQHVGVHLQSTSPGAHLGKAQPPRAAVSARAVASAAAPALPGAAELVCIAYADLESGVDLSAELERVSHQCCSTGEGAGHANGPMSMPMSRPPHPPPWRQQQNPEALAPAVRLDEIDENGSAVT